MSAIVQCHPHPNPHQTPLQPGAGLDSAAPSNPISEKKRTPPAFPTYLKASHLPTRKELGEGVGEFPERVARQDSVMIGFATDAATPIRIDTDTSWAHTAKKTAAPFQQSVTPKPVKFPHQPGQNPLPIRGFLKCQSGWSKTAFKPSNSGVGVQLEGY